MCSHFRCVASRRSSGVLLHLARQPGSHKVLQQWHHCRAAGCYPPNDHWEYNHTHRPPSPNARHDKPWCCAVCPTGWCRQPCKAHGKHWQKHWSYRCRAPLLRPSRSQWWCASAPQWFEFDCCWSVFPVCDVSYRWLQPQSCHSQQWDHSQEPSPFLRAKQPMSLSFVKRQKC